MINIASVGTPPGTPPCATPTEVSFSRTEVGKIGSQFYYTGLRQLTVSALRKPFQTTNLLT